MAKARIEVIPARPSAADLRQLGRGGRGEHDAGLLILDEVGTFLNARQWNDDGRKGVLDWLLHSRKLAWDVVLICQSAIALDKQVREMVCEYHVTCRRMDRVNIPIISWIWPVKFPRVHFATVRYGMGPNDPKAETWVFRGNDLFPCYSTEWMSEADSDGWYTVLPATLSKHRYASGSGLMRALSAWWNGAGRVPGRKPDARLQPLMKLPPERRWQIARQLVEVGAL